MKIILETQLETQKFLLELDRNLSTILVLTHTRLYETRRLLELEKVRLVTTLLESSQGTTLNTQTILTEFLNLRGSIRIILL